jgi:hypothetical protein
MRIESISNAQIDLAAFSALDLAALTALATLRIII